MNRQLLLNRDTEQDVRGRQTNRGDERRFQSATIHSNGDVQDAGDERGREKDAVGQNAIQDGRQSGGVISGFAGILGRIPVENSDAEKREESASEIPVLRRQTQKRN